MFAALSAALQFPYYFGHNWNALDEGLSDLTWLVGRSYALLVTEVDQVLIDEPDDFGLFVEIMRDAAETWAQREPPHFQWRWTKELVRFAVAFHCAFAVKEAVIERFEGVNMNLPIRELERLDDID